VYGPSVCDTIPASHDTTLDEDDKPILTILDVTKFYLLDDPTHPAHIPSYCQNLLYLPEARWHLGVVMGKSTVIGSDVFYNAIRDNHDRIMDALNDREEDDSDNSEEDDSSGSEEDDSDDRIPELTEVEIEAIFDEELEDFFEPELICVVRTLSSSYTLCLII